jgi:acetyl esterase/lipase
MNLQILPTVVACSLAMPMAGGSVDDFRIEKEIDYLGGGKHKADLYLPANLPAGQRCPGIVIIHGGGWTGGDKAAKREINIGTTLAAHGYVCLSINYTLATKDGPATWPENLHQCKTAVRWLRKNADRLHLDPDHIGAIGGSAGGQLVAMLGVTSPADGLDPKEPYGEFSCQVQAVVDLYGPINLMTWHDLSMLGKKRTEAPDLYRQASPITYLKKGQPPFLILHGTADTTVDIGQSKEFAAALAQAGIEHQLVIVEGAPHTFDLQPKQRDLRPVAIDFFDRHLKSRK